MPVINRIADFQAEMAAWRRDMHAHPETAFEEHRTADPVARLLDSFGIAVERGVARTGVIGTLTGDDARAGAPSRCAPTWTRCRSQRRTASPMSRRTHGRMHACGHDGHTAMLLGAAKYLAETRNFAGTVHFIFQPAEENEGGARLMIEEGVFERYPVEAVYGMHNWPGLPAGQFAIRPGPMMAAFDIFEITITGRGAHAAMPHLGIDPVVAAAQIVNGLQTIASRNIDPLQGAVVSVTQIHGGDTWNVIPDKVVLRGTTRSFDPGGARRARAGDPPRRRGRLPPRSAPRWRCATSAAIRRPSTARRKPRSPPRSPRRWSAPTMCAATCCRAWGPRISPAFSKKKPGAYIWIGNGAGARPGDAAQPALRLQRRDPGARRQLLGPPRRNRAGKARRVTRITLG